MVQQAAPSLPFLCPGPSLGPASRAAIESMPSSQYSRCNFFCLLLLLLAFVSIPIAAYCRCEEPKAEVIVGSDGEMQQMQGHTGDHPTLSVSTCESSPATAFELEIL